MFQRRLSTTPERSFIDQSYIIVRSGKGGDGIISFRREKFLPKGGPDGGNGGRGGDVIIKASKDVSTLYSFKYRRHYFAGNGENGSSRQKHGKDAKDLIILVPLGTTILDKETGEVIKDLENDGDFVISKGGKGGRGNKSFATSQEHAPRYAEKGESGREKTVELKLKILSDVGIVGAPNAGKSTLLTAISNARPKIADYPFTTLAPKIGIANLGIGKRLILADLPGLIRGASEGKGMGNRFLSHIERTKVLLFLIDGTVREDIKRTYKMLINELRSYNEELMNKKRVIVVNKIDTWKRKRTKEFEEYFLNMGEPVFFISAIKKEGLRELLQNLYEISLAYKKVDEETPYEERVVEVDEKLLDKVLKIERVDANTFKVSQKEIERRAELSDFKKPGSFEELRRYFERIELEKQLKEAGIKEGDRVIIGNKGFIYKENG